MTISFTIEAKDEEAAHEIASDKFNKMGDDEFRKVSEMGTDAQIMIESEDGSLATEWTDL